MGQLGFSYIGLIYLLMLFIPNFIWTKNKPINYASIKNNENKILLIFEKTGQIFVTCFALIFSFNINIYSIWFLWLVLSFILMMLYEISWFKYFNSKKNLKDFYESFLSIPVPLASLPVLGFLLLGIYSKSSLLVISTIILGIGHIGIHINHMKDIK